MVYIGPAHSGVFRTVLAVITVMRYTLLYAVIVGILGFNLELLGNNIWKWVFYVPTVWAGKLCGGHFLCYHVSPSLLQSEEGSGLKGCHYGSEIKLVLKVIFLHSYIQYAADFILSSV